MAWFLAHLKIIFEVAVVVIAILYALAQGALLPLLLEAWGRIVLWGKDYLRNIPASQFRVWAQLIYDALPTVVRLFVSVDHITNLLIKLRDNLVAGMAPTAGAAMATRASMSVLTTDLARYLAAR